MAEPPVGDKPEAGAGGDPSMEDILASIRRILNEEAPDGTIADAAARAGAPEPADAEEAPLVLDESMLTAAPIAAVPPQPEPLPEGLPEMSAVVQPPDSPPAETVAPPTSEPATPARLLAQETEIAAGGAMATLAARLLANRDSATHRGGPTIEELVREEIRPLLKAWLDQYLPPMVERLVRTEIERLGNRLTD